MKFDKPREQIISEAKSDATSGKVYSPQDLVKIIKSRQRGTYQLKDGGYVEVDNIGTVRWYNEKIQLHREDGPAVEYVDGSKEWWVNGKVHREDGPAVEWVNGYKSWWVNGKRHREDGPAVEYTDGSEQWWVNGEKVTEDEVKKKYPRNFK